MNHLLNHILSRSASPAEAASRTASSDTQRLLDRWEQRLLLNHPDQQLFEKRLAALGLDRNTALAYLSPCAWPDDRPLPAWAELLREVLEPGGRAPCPITSESIFNPPPRDPGEESQPLQFPVFPEFVGPFLDLLHQRLQESPAAVRWLAESAREDVIRFAAWRLSGLAGRTLAHEMKQCAARGELKGSTPQERYQDFMTRLAGDRAWQHDLFRQYPVLARLLAVRCGQHSARTTEILSWLDQDAERLAARFNDGRELGQVVRFEAGLSDSHNGGRSVSILHFASGLRLVCKPRSLRADTVYAALIDWWNSQGVGPDLKAARVVEGAEYGWAEFVATEECRSRAEVAEYFRRQGAQAAFLWFLQGADFHGENFIAHGAYPAPIDLEGLLSPIRARYTMRSADLPPYFGTLDGTVQTSCMLPIWKMPDRGRVCCTDSALAGSGDRSWVSTAHGWTGLGTDELRLQMLQKERRTDDSLPRLGGVPVGPQDFVPDILDGFARVYRTLAAQRHLLLAPGGLLAGFRDVHSRCLLRDTSEYTFLLYWSTAPDHLTSGAAHDIAFEMLCKYGCGFGNSLDLVDIEKRLLWQRDVPLFAGSPASRKLHDPEGHELPLELPHSSWEQMEKAFALASEEDLAWQQEVIRASLQMALEPACPGEVLKRTAGTVSHAEMFDQGFEDSAPAARSAEQRLLDKAIDLGRALERLALRAGTGVTWMTLGAAASGEPGTSLAGHDLYGGCTGTALFLANLARAANEPAFAKLARAALHFAAAADDYARANVPEYGKRIAGFSGTYGLLYAQTEIGRVLQDEQLIDAARDRLLELDPAPTVVDPDFINGCGGALRTLLHLHALRPDGRILQRAQMLAEGIQERRAASDSRGLAVPWCAWPLLGLGHGQCGIALALDGLDRHGAAAWIHGALMNMLRIEEEGYDAALEDWPDLREAQRSKRFMIGWCAGACGHGLARLGLLGGSADTANLRRDLDRALAATRRQLGTAPHNLCCGEPGRIWLLAQAGRRLDRPELVAEARTAALGLIDYRRENGCWLMNPVTERAILPGLMGGISGIGLALLQARRPGEVSQVVTLS